MTMGLACDRDGYDLRIPPCKGCGSRGCANGFRCRPAVAVPADYFDKHPREAPPSYRALQPPNRLYGARINEDGDAV
jgi:hypothetical protein